MSGIDVTSMLKANDGMIEVVRNAQKKQKTQHISGASPYFETIAMKLWEQQRDLRKNYDDAKLETIEIEVITRKMWFVCPYFITLAPA